MTEPSLLARPGVPVLNLAAFDLAAIGYQAAEFVVDGEASSYAPIGALGNDGDWRVEEAEKAAYRTRLVAVTPTDPARFSGTLLVEWLNVTAGVDAPVDWVMAHREIVRAGHAYVAVSAQRVGVEGGVSRGIDRSLKTLDPGRYADLHHPGDAFSYDIFTQVSRLLRDHPETVLGTLRPDHVIAVGESQSAWYLVSYVNAVDPIERVYDGYLIHSRFAPAGPFDGASIFESDMAEMPVAPRIRDDVRTPVMTVITETDLIGGLRLGFCRVGQADGPNQRVWEIAGTAHADNYAVQVGLIDDGRRPVEELAAGFAPTQTLFGMQMPSVINFAPQHHYVLQAALAGLERWVRTGEAPPTAPRLALDQADPPALVLDAHDLAIGGIRTPWVDVPIARTTGLGDASIPALSLLGGGELFDAARLARLYPGSRADYLARFAAALDETISRGFLLAADRDEMLGLAAASYPGK